MKDKNIVYSQEEFTVSTEKSNSGKNVNDKVDKLTRMAFAEIHYGAEEINDASDTQINVTESGEVESNTATVTNTPSGSTEDTTVENRVLQNVDVNSRYDYEARFFKQLKLQKKSIPEFQGVSFYKPRTRFYISFLSS